MSSDGDPSPGISDTLIVQVCPPIPGTVAVAIVSTNGTAVTANLTEAMEVAGTALKCVIPDAQWLRELDWALVDQPTAGGPPEIGGLLYLRNEGPNAAVYLLGLAENGPPLVPPRPNPISVPESGIQSFLADLLLANALNRTVKIRVTSDGTMHAPITRSQPRSVLRSSIQSDIRTNDAISKPTTSGNTAIPDGTAK